MLEVEFNEHFSEALDKKNGKGRMDSEGLGVKSS